MKRIVKGLSVLVVVASTVVAGVSASAGTPSRHEARWSDRQVVEGVALARGPVAQQLGIAQAFSDSVPKETRRQGLLIERNILDDMMFRDRAGIHRAAQLLTSGDPYKVEEGRRLLVVRFNASLAAQYPDLASNAVASSRCGLIAACAAVAVLAAALGVAVVVVGEVAVVGHAAVYAKQALWGKSESLVAHNEPSSPSFPESQFNALLAERLG